MFDEETESLWPQMCAVAAIGSRQGTELVHVAAIEMRWEAWKARHPETLVVSSETGFDMDYHRYPYGSYETNEFLLFGLAEPVDTRLHMKDRVFGIPEGDGGGLAIPFDELAGNGTWMIRTLIDGETVVVLWDDEARAAASFHPQTQDGVPVVLRVDRRGFVDAETGSVWNVEGVAVAGPMKGASLAPYLGTVTAFWFAWSAFHPATRIWGQE